MLASGMYDGLLGEVTASEDVLVRDPTLRDLDEWQTVVKFRPSGGRLCM